MTISSLPLIRQCKIGLCRVCSYIGNNLFAFLRFRIFRRQHCGVGYECRSSSSVALVKQRAGLALLMKYFRLWPSLKLSPETSWARYRSQIRFVWRDIVFSNALLPFRAFLTLRPVISICHCGLSYQFVTLQCFKRVKLYKSKMLMPKKNRVAIYEHLFKEGVMVAKKDHFAPKHQVSSIV